MTIGPIGVRGGWDLFVMYLAVEEIMCNEKILGWVWSSSGSRYVFDIDGGVYYSLEEIESISPCDSLNKYKIYTIWRGDYYMRTGDLAALLFPDKE